MKRLCLALLAAASLSAENYGGFSDAKVRVLAENPAPGTDRRLRLTLVILRGSNWSEKRVLRHLERTRATFQACGVSLGPVTLVEARAPDGSHDLDMAEMDAAAGAPNDVVRIAGLLPRDADWPVAFFAGRLQGDSALARSYGRGRVEPGREPDYPYMNTAWFAYKAHWIERRDDSYSSLAHELAHLLCECGHVESANPHMLNTHRNMLSSRLLPEHCERIRRNSSPAPTNAVQTPINH